MKKLLIGLLVLGSFSSFAKGKRVIQRVKVCGEVVSLEENYKNDVHTLNVLLDTIDRSRETSVFNESCKKILKAAKKAKLPVCYTVTKESYEDTDLKMNAKDCDFGI